MKTIDNLNWWVWVHWAVWCYTFNDGPWNKLDAKAGIKHEMDNDYRSYAP